MKTGLVLEGGAMRGMFTCGVLDVFMENDIPVDGIIGVSAGACFGVNYKSKQPGRAIRYNRRFCKDWRYASLRSWLTTGAIYGEEFDYHVVPYQYDLFDTKTYAENPIPFYAGCTDARTGKPLYLEMPQGDHHDLTIMNGSASQPVFGNIIRVDGMELSDGGISDSVPIQAFQQMGYEKNIVILTQPAGFRAKKQVGIPLLRLLYPRHQKMLDALADRHNEYNTTLDYLASEEARGTVFILQPEEPLNISFLVHDPDELQRVYDHGRRVAEHHLADVKAFVDKTTF